METYKIIKNYQNYEISNLGNVRNKTTGKILKTYLDKNGYLYVNLCGKNNKIHRLVAEQFVKNKLKLNVVDHKDTNKLNNNANNLRFCTISENNKNRKFSKNNKLKIKNIRIKKNGKYEVRIASDGKNVCGETFSNLEDAILVRNEYLLYFHKQFANYN